MKLSVSLPDDDVAFLDDYVRSRGAGSRSGVLHTALVLLRQHELSADYQSAWDEWGADDNNAAWDAAVADGIDAR